VSFLGNIRLPLFIQKHRKSENLTTEENLARHGYYEKKKKVMNNRNSYDANERNIRCLKLDTITQRIPEL
jgi:hypothetical protein